MTTKSTTNAQTTKPTTVKPTMTTTHELRSTLLSTETVRPNKISTQHSSKPSSKPVTTTQYVTIPTQTNHLVSSDPTTSISQSSTKNQVVYPYMYGWTAWSLWSPCDLQCRHSRYRFCMNYDPRYCPGENSESRDCPFPCKRK